MKSKYIENLSSEGDGAILVDKPAGMTSFGAVARVRRQLREFYGRKIKVGHTGTLDPFATGLLVLLVGKYTKKSAEFLKCDKEYIATIFLGAKSSTGDPEGEIRYASDFRPDEAEILRVLKEFTGEIIQKPPKFSAIKINGERAYRLARKGKEFEMPERRVKIYKIELIKYEYPELKIRCFVSAGTYIRTLAEDIGGRFGTGAYCKELRRTKVGEYKVEDAIKITET